MNRSALWLLVSCLPLGCSTPKPEPAVPENTAQSTPPPNAAVVVPSDASDALRSVAPDATLVVRLRGDKLRDGPMFGAVSGIKQALPQARQGLAIVQAACGFDPVEAIQEIVIAGKHRQRASAAEPLGRWNLDPRSASAALLLDRPADEALKCLGNFVPAKQREVGGNPALELPTGGVLQTHGNLLVYTPAAAAEPAAARIRKGAALEPGLQAVVDANRDATLLSYAKGENTLGLEWLSIAVSQPAGGLFAKGVGLADSPEDAAKVAEAIQAQVSRAEQRIRADSNTPAAQKLVDLLEEIHVERNGASLSAELVLDKDRAEQFFSEVLGALIADGMQRYVAAAKTAEARDNVMRIALALSDYARANRPPKKRFPPSAPLSPPEVPRGKPVDASASFDDQSWQAIGFAPRDPVYFAYEFITAPDGKSVEVIAHGDLDADGTQSKYSVKVTLENNEPKIDSTLQREHPFE